MLYVDANTYQLKSVNKISRQVSVVAGSGKKATMDGSSSSAAFAQPCNICTEGKSIYVTDISASKVLLITPMEGTQEVLSSLQKLFNGFGVRERTKTKEKRNQKYVNQ